MKIDGDLRAAIRMAEKGQGNEWEVKRQIQNAKSAAIAKFLKSGTAKAKRLRKAVADYKKAKALIRAAKAVASSCGLYLNDSTPSLDDETRFRSVGGMLSPSCVRWKAEQVIAELLAADARKRKSILKNYGINWD